MNIPKLSIHCTLIISRKPLGIRLFINLKLVFIYFKIYGNDDVIFGNDDVTSPMTPQPLKNQSDSLSAQPTQASTVQFPVTA